MIYAINNAGDFGVPGFGVVPRGARVAVPSPAAAWMATRDEFELDYSEAERSDFADPQYIGYLGPIDARYGYGGGGISIVRALLAAGQVPVVNQRYGMSGTKDVPLDILPHLGFTAELPWVELVHALPDALPSARSPHVVAWTMWESSQLPNGNLAGFTDWVSLINKYAERVVVPCEHNKGMFRASGVRPPITVIPYGVDTDVWAYRPRQEKQLFVVSQFGDLTHRKGPLEAVEAFQRAFPTEPDVRLVLKTARGRFEWTSKPQYLPTFTDPRIRLIDEVWERERLLQLLYSSDVFIWLSRGEGFGLPPLQAVLTGTPVVMTAHTGMAEYYDRRFFYGVGSPTMSASPLGGEWYEPDVDEAAEHLRAIYKNRQAAYKKAALAQAPLRKRFGIEAFGQRIRSFIQTVEGC